MRLPIFREIFKIWKYPPVLISWQNDFFINFLNFQSQTGEDAFLGVFWAFFPWKSENEIAVLKRKNQEMKLPSNTYNQRMMLKSRIFIKNLQDSANTERIVFSPRASFSRHPQYIPAPSVYRYRRVYQAFRGTLNRAWPPVSVSIPSCSHADVPRLVTRNSDKNQKNFLLHKHISLKSASTHQEQSTLISVKITIFSNSTCAKDLEEPENDILSEIYLFRIF